MKEVEGGAVRPLPLGRSATAAASATRGRLIGGVSIELLRRAESEMAHAQRGQ